MIRRWLIRLLLTKNERDVLGAALNCTLDTWSECVRDPSMYRTKDDMKIAASVRQDMWTLDCLLKGAKKASQDKFYAETAGLEEVK